MALKIWRVRLFEEKRVAYSNRERAADSKCSISQLLDERKIGPVEWGVNCYKECK